MNTQPLLSKRLQGSVIKINIKPFIILLLFYYIISSVSTVFIRSGFFSAYYSKLFNSEIIPKNGIGVIILHCLFFIYPALLILKLLIGAIYLSISKKAWFHFDYLIFFIFVFIPQLLFWASLFTSIGISFFIFPLVHAIGIIFLFVKDSIYDFSSIHIQELGPSIQDKRYVIFFLIFSIIITIGAIKITTIRLGRFTSLCSMADTKINQDQCYSHNAVAKKDFSYCEKIQDISYRDDCYHEVASVLFDASVCTKISTFDKRDSCYHYIARQKQDLSMCQNISNKFSRVRCYVSVASKQNISDICGNLTNLQDRDECYWQIVNTSISQSDETSILIAGNSINQSDEVCSLINDIYTRDSCFSTYATSFPANQSKVSSCGKIQNLILRDNCYELLGRSLLDVFICDKIQDQSKKDTCYWGVATIKDDPSICGRIKTTIIKNKCYEGI